MIKRMLAAAMLLPTFCNAPCRGEELTSFTAGDRIVAAEVNKNFQLLQQQMDKQAQKIECVVSDITGKWMYVKHDDDDLDYELGEITFSSDLTLNWIVRSRDDGNRSFSGSYEIDSNDDKCAVEGKLFVADATWDFYAWPNDSGDALPLLVHKVAVDEFASQLLQRFNRKLLSD